MLPARILIAEDHPASLELMRYLLQASGYSTMSAKDGITAVEIARAERPDLVICDLQMPGLSGYEVLDALRGDPDLRTIPLIAATAFSMLGDRERVLTAGFNAYFSKPIEPETFVQEIASFIAVPFPPDGLGAT